MKVIPCRLVVGANGELGGLSAAGGTDLKRRLLNVAASVNASCTTQFY